MKKLGIIVPTANRPHMVDLHISSLAEKIMKYQVDLIIFDSSRNDETKKVVERYVKEGVTNLIYDFYDGPIDKMSLDGKMLCVYKKYARKYEYVVGCRDGLSLELESFIHLLDSSVYDLLVINQTYRNFKHYPNKEYTDCGLLFLEQAQHTTALGAMILKSTLLRSVLEQVPLDMERHYTLWQPFAFFEYFAAHPFRALYYVGNVWTPICSEENKTGSFWHKYTLWQWGERWYKLVMSLPAKYDCYKEEVLKFEGFDCRPFCLSFLLHVHKLGGLTPWIVYKNRKYLRHVCKVPMWKLYVISVLPRPWSRKLFKNHWENGYFNNVLNMEL